jgi:phospholipase/lecithinase/hemolysin
MDAPFTAFYAFGDSLVDNGNDFILTQRVGLQPAIPPSTSPHRAYFDGRFSNGPVAFEYLWQLLSGATPGTADGLMPLLQDPIIQRHRAIDFAFGGTGTGQIDPTPGGFFAPGLRGQVDLYRALLGRRRAPADAVFAIFAGAGDYLRTTPLAPAQSVANIVASVQMLYAVGARTVIVLNLPDLGTIPMFAGQPQSAPLSQLTAAHNAALAAALSDLQTSLPDLRLVAIDVNAVLEQVPPTINTTLPALDALVPAAPGQPPTSMCLFLAPATCPDVPTFDVGDQFLFWDAEHPTTAVHQLLAQYIAGQLQAPAAITTSNTTVP